MARISIPTTGRLSSSLRIASTNPAVLKLLNRLSRASLLDLVIDWLTLGTQPTCRPLLRQPRRRQGRRDSGDHDEDGYEDEDNEDEEDEYDGDMYPPMRSLADLHDLYKTMASNKGSKREVVERISEGDWRAGLSLYQLATADMRYLFDHMGWLRWSAFRIHRLRPPTSTDNDEPNRNQNQNNKIDDSALSIPRFHPSTFLENLQSQMLPDVKAHFNLAQPPGHMPVTLIRVFMLDSPYNTSLATTTTTTSSSSSSSLDGGGARTLYIAFPDASPYIYISKAQTTSGASSGASETRSLRNLIVDAIPKALSRPQERFTMRATGLVTRNLEAMLAVKGPGRGNAAQGGWSIYADEGTGKGKGKGRGRGNGMEAQKDSPLNPVLPSPPLSDADVDADVQGEKDKQVGGRKRIVDPEMEKQERARKHAKLVARARFADTARVHDGRGVERVDILMEDPFPTSPSTFTSTSTSLPAISPHTDVPLPVSTRHNSRVGILRAYIHPGNGDEDEDDGEDPGGQNTWRPPVRLTFHGPHVFAGIRQLVEAGIVDGERMPGWMTGEEGVTVGAVREGRVRGHKGAGL